MKILFYELGHFSPNFHKFTGSWFENNICQKKNLPFLAQKFEKKQNLSNKTKKRRKKVAWTTKPLV